MAIPLASAFYGACSSSEREFSGGPDSGTGGSAGSATGGTSGASTGGTGGTGDSGSDASTTGCTEAELDQPVTGTTNGAADRFRASCGTGKSGDVSYSFTAPATGYYNFDSTGSSYDTVVAVFESCTGREVACNNDFGGKAQGQASALVQQGQTVVVVVDGNTDEGNYSLAVTPVTCPADDVTGQVFPATLTTTGGTNSFSGPCGGANSLEKSLRYTADTAGMYRFSARTSAFTPIMNVSRGAACGGELLQCNTNVVSGHPAEVTRYLQANESVTVTVDAVNNMDGEFTLDVKKIATQCPTQAAFDTNTYDVKLLSTSPHVLSPSCAWAGNISPANGADHPYPDHSFPLHVDLGTSTSCSYDITVSSGNGLVAYLLKGTQCDGPEVRCTESTTNMVTFTFQPEDEGDYVLVVDNQDPFGADMTYSVKKTCN